MTDLCPYLELTDIKTSIKKTVIPKYVLNSHVEISSQILSGPSFGLLSLALRTTVTQPPTATITPSPSLILNCSCSNKGAIKQFETKATTPSGDTTEAGAKP